VEKLMLPPGSNEICITAVNGGTGGNAQLGCRTVVATMPDLGRTPTGSFESLTASGETGTASGWTLDPDTNASIEVHLYVNGVGKAYVANKARGDVGAVYPQLGVNHGFVEQFPLKSGANEVCAYGINTGPGGNSFLGCRTVTVAQTDLGRAPVGNFESLTVSGTTATATGWSLDPDTSAPIAVHLYVNGAGKEYIANKGRPDVGAAYPALGNDHGFTEQITLGSGRTEVCAYGINNGTGSNTYLGCRSVTVQAPAESRAPLGYFESVTPASGGAAIAGWALDPDTTASIEIHVYVDGVGRALIANKLRPDVGAAYRLGDNHGFTDLVPMSPGAHNVCVYGIDTAGVSNALIGCRSVNVS
jgi:hypothetical protein